jgi:DNA-directed RNA polymerase subunit N
MIIPVKCVTCGKVLADKWEYYKKKCEEMDKKNETDKKPESKYFKEPFRKQILDELELDRYCCRRHMLSHVDIIDYL